MKESGKFLNGNKYRLDGCYIELTSLCNLRCKHCYNDSGILKNEISEKAFRNILNCYDSDVNPYLSFSGGEPLLHPKFWNYVDMALDSGITDILLITNATLITDDVAKKIKERNISVQVSINSITPEIHDAICGAGSLKKTLQGLQFLLDNKVNKVLTRYTMTKANKDDFVHTIEELAKKGVSNVLLGAIQDIGRAKDNEQQLALTLQERNEILINLQNNKQLSHVKEEYLSIFELPAAYTGGCPLILPNNKNEWTNINPRIDSSGNVFLCQSFNDELYSIGNINNNTLSDIINSEQVERLINFLYAGTFYNKDCKSCIWKNRCSRGCVAESIQRDSIQVSDGDCSLRKIDFAKEIISASQA